MKKPTSSPLHKAIRFAVKQHAGQFRDGDSPLPYACHPIEVVALLRHEAGCTDEAMLCAAALHDAVEMGGVSIERIKRRFGGDVASLVGELTRKEPEAEQLEGLDEPAIWRLRADMLVEEIGAMSERAQLIKLCDRTSNVMEAVRTKKGAKLERYVWQTRRILATIPRDRCPLLWDRLSDMAKQDEKPET